MQDFIKSLRFKILVGLLCVLLGFMIMAVYSGGAAPLFAQVVSLITMPVQRISSGIAGNASDFFDKFLNAREIYEENQQLREQVVELRQRMVDYDKAVHENEQFRQIIGVMEDHQDLTIQTASVTARDPLGRFYSFTIDKGSLNGVSRLDPVMTADGLVGYVTEVGPTYAKVATILDVTVDVGVYDSATRDIGIVSGTIDLAADGLCQMEYLDRDSEIAPGDLILTSGSGGSLFPKDILVGTVQEVIPSPHGVSLAAVIKPAADIATVKDVFVIIDPEGQDEE